LVNAPEWSHAAVKSRLACRLYLSKNTLISII
jgi:hypothetical protein